MPIPPPGGSAQVRWAEIATEYAEAFGWRVVPLHSNPDLAAEADDDPVIRQLGWLPLVDVPDDASARPDRIQEWACYPTAPVAVLTGRTSNLVALELPHDDGRAPLQDEIRRRLGPLPDTRRIVGPDRTYYLFSIPEAHPPLPTLTHRDGCVLHGDDSLIRVPSRPGSPDSQPFEWDLFAAENLAPLPDSLRARFDLPDAVDPGDPSADGHPLRAEMPPSIEDKLPEGSFSLSDAADLPDVDGSTFPLQNRGTQNAERTPASTRNSGAPAARSAASHGDASSAEDPRDPAREPETTPLPFCTGEDLAPSSDDRSEALVFPWMAAGALTLLTGRPKTAGKSTFVVNLAAHLAGGRSFLGRDVPPTPVVLLSDLPARPFRAVLAHLGLDAAARARLYVLHPRAVANRGWSYVLDHAFQHADRVGAPLVILDSLDTYIRAKDGPDPCRSDDVVHALTAGAPSDCAVLAVKSVPTTRNPATSGHPELPIAPTDLDLLGVAADVIAHLQDVSTSRYPTLRRLLLTGRLAPMPSYVLCEMVRGRYKRLQPSSRGDGVHAPGSQTATAPDLSLSSAGEADG